MYYFEKNDSQHIKFNFFFGINSAITKIISRISKDFKPSFFLCRKYYKISCATYSERRKQQNIESIPSGAKTQLKMRTSILSTATTEQMGYGIVSFFVYSALQIRIIYSVFQLRSLSLLQLLLQLLILLRLQFLLLERLMQLLRQTYCKLLLRYIRGLSR